jgi:hypothetical protein
MVKQFSHANAFLPGAYYLFCLRTFVSSRCLLRCLLFCRPHSKPRPAMLPGAAGHACSHTRSAALRHMRSACITTQHPKHRCFVYSKRSDSLRIKLICSLVILVST